MGQDEGGWSRGTQGGRDMQRGLGRLLPLSRRTAHCWGTAEELIPAMVFGPDGEACKGGLR